MRNATQRVWASPQRCLPWGRQRVKGLTGEHPPLSGGSLRMFWACLNIWKTPPGSSTIKTCLLQDTKNKDDWNPETFMDELTAFNVSPPTQKFLPAYQLNRSMNGSWVRLEDSERLLYYVYSLVQCNKCQIHES